ncbi:Phage tail tube protein FII [compost metagenome]
MEGPVKVDLGHSDDGIQLEWTLGGWDLIALRQFAAVRVDAVQLRFAASVQRDDTGEVSAVEIVMRGRHEEVDFGDAEPGEDTEHKITSALTYYKLTVDGEEIIEIDLLNFIYVVDGKDMLEEHRKAIGI